MRRRGAMNAFTAIDAQKTANSFQDIALANNLLSTKFKLVWGTKEEPRSILPLRIECSLPNINGCGRRAPGPAEATGLRSRRRRYSP